MAGIASFMVGGFLGFLFGIPRYASDPAVSGQDDKYSANTNLEQISDWLTKIIVGAGLTQFRAIGGWVSDVARRLATGLVHGRPTGNEEALAMGLLLLTAICGFLFFYLWSRVYLPQIFEVADAPSRPSVEGQGVGTAPMVPSPATRARTTGAMADPPPTGAATPPA